jgi:hypothetical protein
MRPHGRPRVGGRRGGRSIGACDVARWEVGYDTTGPHPALRYSELRLRSEDRTETHK